MFFKLAKKNTYFGNEMTGYSRMLKSRPEPILHITDDRFVLSFNIQDDLTTANTASVLVFEDYYAHRSVPPHSHPAEGKRKPMNVGEMHEYKETEWITELCKSPAIPEKPILSHYIFAFPDQVLEVVAVKCFEHERIGTSRTAMKSYLAEKHAMGNSKETPSVHQRLESKETEEIRTAFEQLFVDRGPLFIKRVQQKKRVQQIADQIEKLSSGKLIQVAKDLNNDLLCVGGTYDLRDGGGSHKRYCENLIRGIPQSILIVLTASGNGYLREAALEALPDKLSEAELCFLLPRTNDWVDHVRERARWLFEQNITVLSPAIFYELLPLVLFMKGRKQRTDDGYFDRLLDVLQTEEFIPYLQNGIVGDNRQVRRFCLSEYMLNPHQPIEDKILWCMENASFDLVCKAIAYTLEHDHDLSMDTINRACNHSSGQVRKLALRAALRMDNDPAVKELFARLLMDRSPAVQYVASYYAKNRFDVDCGEFYRNQLSHATGQQLATTLSGLNLTNVALEPAQIDIYMRDPLVRARCEALRNAGATEEHFNHGLQDNSPKVIRRAIERAAFRDINLSGDKISKLLLFCEDARKINAYIAFIGNLPRYDKLTFLLSLYRRSGYDLHKIIEHKLWTLLCGGFKPKDHYLIRNWLRNRGLTNLTYPTQAEKYQKAFDAWQHAKEAFQDPLFIEIIDAEFAILGFKDNEDGKGK